MGDPRRVRPDEVEILVARELRKASLSLTGIRMLQRGTLSQDATSDFWMTLLATGTLDEKPVEIIVAFRNQSEPVTADVVQQLATVDARANADAPTRLMPAPEEAASADGRAPRRRVTFSTAGYDVDAIRVAKALGVVLLAVADGPAAFRRSQWSIGEQAPAWIPEYMTELVTLGADGSPRRDLLSSGNSTLFRQ